MKKSMNSKVCADGQRRTRRIDLSRIITKIARATTEIDSPHHLHTVIVADFERFVRGAHRGHRVTRLACRTGGAEGAMDSAADAALLREWVRGDSRAGAALVARHLVALRRFFRRTGGPDADDLVQQTLVACLESAHQFREQSSFRAFLLGVARNQLRSHRRFRRRHQEMAASPPEFFDEVEAPAYNRGKREYRQEAVLAHAMTQLPPELRTVLELFYWHHGRQEDIATLLGVPVGTVASRIRRGRKKLRHLLGVSAPGEEAAPDSR
jgi:RNA polymerase sigma factor (sigma-70 family)